MAGYLLTAEKQRYKRHFEGMGGLVLLVATSRKRAQIMFEVNVGLEGN